MKTTKPFLVILFCLIFFTLGLAKVNGQITDNAKNKKAIIFLENFLTSYNKQKTSNFSTTKEFVSLPKDLESNLQKAFPKHKFLLAKLNYSIDTTFLDANLILITDENDVIGYCGDIVNFGGQGSDSFKKFLTLYQPESKKFASFQTKVLSELIAFQYGRVKQTYIKKGMIYTKFSWSNGKVWRILEVPLDKQNHFGVIKIINPISGKEE